MKRQSIFLLLAAVLLVSLFAGCGKTGEAGAGGEGPSASNRLKKTMTITDNTLKYDLKSDSFTYQAEDGTIGFKTYRGDFDSGLVYRSLGEYVLLESGEKAAYVFSSEASEMKPEVGSVNRFGVVDTKGTVLIPAEYATISFVDDVGAYIGVSRYAIAGKATERVESEDSVSYNYISRYKASEEEQDIQFSLVYDVYDLETGATVPNLTGLPRISAYASSDYLGYRLEGYQRHYVDPSGKELEEGVEVLANGTYIKEEGDSIAVYRMDGSRVFLFDRNQLQSGDQTPRVYDIYYGHEPDGAYFVQTDELSNSEYLLDDTGKVLSTGLFCPVGVFGPFVYSYTESNEKRLFTRDGQQLPYGDFEDYTVDRAYGRGLGLSKENGTGRSILMDMDGSVLLDVTNDENNELYMQGNMYYARKTIDGQKYLYNFKEKDYTIRGTPEEFWLATAKIGEKKVLMDTFTGEVLLEGYDRYDVYGWDRPRCVVAESKTEPIVDIYVFD